MSHFRLTGRQFFLTYPQCPISKELAITILTDISPVVAYVAAEEKHEDGSPHLHIYLKFERKKMVKSPKCFDLEYDGITYHGNYQTVKNADATMNYIKKDKNFIEKLEEEEVEEDIIDFAKNHSNEDFLRECIKRKISVGYYNEIKSIICSNNTINEDSAGNCLFNEEQFQNAYKKLDSIQSQAPSMMTEKSYQLLESLLSSPDQPVAVKQPGASTTYQNQSCLSPILIPLNSSTQNTNQFSLTTYPSNTFREKAKSIWSTVNNLDQSTLDTEQLTFQQDWSKPLLQTTIHSTKWNPLSKEEYVF